MTALDALNRARAAWEATQPQLVIDGWTTALDDTDPSAHLRVGVIERAPTHASLDGGALNPCGTEPHSDITAAPHVSHRVDPVIRPPLAAGSSVPHHLNNDGPVRITGERMRGRGQGG